ncbi:hypothetical protein BJV82DRAFT_677601 [Fennellomyces sp. T-0311]|nr:hypothetical protein BJV82DRAFT_677601 [Fennellomyces sp. T-0311]
MVLIPGKMDEESKYEIVLKQQLTTHLSIIFTLDESTNYTSDDEKTTVGSDDSVTPVSHHLKRSSHKFKNLYLLCSKQAFEKRIDHVKLEKKQIAPQQLSTNGTAHSLELMRTKDLIDSFLFRFQKRNPQVKRIRETDLTYYNWLLLDLARRMEVIQQRLQQEFPHTWEEELRRQVIEPTAERVSWSIKSTRSFGMISEDKEYFDLFPVFVQTKRFQMLEVARVFGDEICAFTEFIDMHRVANLAKEGFHLLLKELSLVKDQLEDSIKMLQPLFENDPVHPYETMVILD